MVIFAHGAEPVKPDPDLPQPLDLSVAATLIEKPPFTRALNLSEKLQLTGIAYVQGKPVVSLLDRETKQSYLVSEEPNALGWKLAGASASTALKLTNVQLQVGTEVVTIHYGEAQIAPKTQIIKYPTDAEALTVVNGLTYVKGSAYLSEADRERYYRGISREAHEKYREILRNNREMMLKATHEERAAFARKMLDVVEAEDKTRQRR
jgi:hypothetical protein